jgi:hypothetical protein
MSSFCAISSRGVHGVDLDVIIVRCSPRPPRTNTVVQVQVYDDLLGDRTRLAAASTSLPAISVGAPSSNRVTESPLDRSTASLLR